jgi:subtilase family serine protease
VRVGFETVDFPASSPFATAVGGTSVALNANRTIAWQTGWGTNLTRIAGTIAEGSPPVVPPLHLGFQSGAGGGSSLIFAKPSFQSGIPGTTRQTPDIGMLADPFTGAEIIQTDTSTGQLFVEVIGGTSLATPLFSAVMSVAAQKAQHGLGQAAPLLYGLGSGIIDVTPFTSATNVSGTITTSSGTTVETADDLAQPLDGVTTYFSAIYNSPFSTRWFALMFGTDTSLKTTVGYDNVTGIGSPDGANFVNALVP